MSVVKKKKAPFDMYSSEGKKKPHSFHKSLSQTTLASDDS